MKLAELVKIQQQNEMKARKMVKTETEAFKFWKTQPVPKLGESHSFSINRLLISPIHRRRHCARWTN